MRLRANFAEPHDALMGNAQEQVVALGVPLRHCVNWCIKFRLKGKELEAHEDTLRG